MKIIKKKVFWIVLCLFVTVGGYYWYSSANSKSAGTSYITVKAQKGAITASVSASGSIVVDQIANIDPTISGTVSGLSVSVGDRVKKGDYLFSIDNDDLGRAVNKALASYNSSVISKNQAREDYTEAKDKERHDSSAYSESELKNLKDKVSLAEDQMKNAWSDYLSAKEDAGERRVTASIDGTVNEINIENGDSLNDSLSNSNNETPIIIGDLNTMKAKVQVNEVDIPNVKVGQIATVTFDAIEGLTLAGKVEKIDALGTSNSGVVTYDVIIFLDSLDERIRPQMSVSAEIITNNKEDIITVPSSAIKTRNGENYVQVLKNGVPENRTVNLGIAGDTDTEVISGINIGDDVITQTVSASQNENKDSSTLKESSSSSKSNSSKSNSSSDRGGPPMMMGL